MSGVGAVGAMIAIGLPLGCQASASLGFLLPVLFVLVRFDLVFVLLLAFALARISLLCLQHLHCAARALSSVMEMMERR